MKISAYHKSFGFDVKLITDYEDLNGFEKIYLSKVFTDTIVPDWVLNIPNIEYGGTGFYFDKAPDLPDCIEHQMPDYHLYDEWVQKQIDKGVKKKQS